MWREKLASLPDIQVVLALGGLFAFIFIPMAVIDAMVKGLENSSVRQPMAAVVDRPIESPLAITAGQ